MNTVLVVVLPIVALAFGFFVGRHTAPGRRSRGGKKIRGSDRDIVL